MTLLPAVKLSLVFPVPHKLTPRKAEQPFTFTNGIQASHVEVDIDTGFVRLLKHWVIEDCGTIINPLLVDEQLRGGASRKARARLLA